MPSTPIPIYQSDPTPLPPKPKEEELILEWASPSRPYKERTREFYTTVGSIVFLLAVILLLLNEFLLIGVIISFAFLSYVLASHKPDTVTHQITTFGIRTDDKFYEWDTLRQFWLKKEWDQEIIICQTKTNFPGVILLVLDPKQKDDIVQAISRYIPLVKPVDTFVDKASRWLSEKIPLESKP